MGLALAPQFVGDGGDSEWIWRAAVDQARDRMLALRLISGKELAARIALFDDPSFVDVATILVSAWARKPAAIGGVGCGS